MCLVVYAASAHPDFPFILIHNRDEVFARATQDPVDSSEDGVICGTDGLAGGTWLGFNRHTGILAALTNVRHVAFPEVVMAGGVSRGLFVRDWLRRPGHATTLPTAGVPLALNGRYNGFNLLLTNLFTSCPVKLISNAPQPAFSGSAGIYSNDTAQVYDISDGVHAMSNSSLDDPTWPKVALVTKQLREVVADKLSLSSAIDENKAVETLANKLLHIMTNDADFPPDDLPDVTFSTDPPTMERLRHNQKVFQPAGYALDNEVACFGTRAQSIIIKSQKNVHFLYRNTDTWPTVPSLLHYVIPIPPQQTVPIIDESKSETLSIKRAVTLGIGLLFTALAFVTK